MLKSSKMKYKILRIGYKKDVSFDEAAKRLALSDRQLFELLNLMDDLLDHNNLTRSFHDNSFGEVEYQAYRNEKLLNYIPLIVSNAIAFAALIVSIFK